MKRQDLINQVKEEYAGIAAHQSQQHFHETNAGVSARDYYEELQNAVVHDINQGKFDTCRSGSEIVNKVAADKSILSQWG